MEIKMITMGILSEETVNAAVITRDEFMEVVENTLAEGEFSQAVADKVLPVAQTMTTFPMQNWIHPTRGCGCVVGEYLIAADYIEREAFAHSEGIYDTLVTCLNKDPNGGELRQFGNMIDDHLETYVTDKVGYEFSAVAIKDA